VALNNPAFTKETFAGYDQVYGTTRTSTMTVQGTIGKTFGLLGILSATAIWSWNQAAQGQLGVPVVIGAGLGTFVLAMITIFKKNFAPWTAPLHAGFEGVFLGALSAWIEVGALGKAYPGIVIQAVSMTCGTLFCMLFVYATGLVKVTQKLRTGVIAATGAIALVYLVAMVMSMFGRSVPFLNDASPLGIGISVVIVGVAAFNLLLNFDFVEMGARAQAPKYMEWYAAFGLILTLVWLYLEILDLLRKIQDRR